MRTIDLETWPRREYFKVFNNWEYPHFNLCAQVDVTAFYPAVKQRAVSLTAAMVYMLTRSANEMPEFRQRIRGDQVVEHEVIHPSTTILGDNDLFGFCMFDYSDNFASFAAHATERIAEARVHPTITQGQADDDRLYMTGMPWVSFTSVMHPLKLPADSIPRIAWGKFAVEGDERLKMPLSVQAHHALMDGVHVGHFYEKVQDYLDHPARILGAE